MTVAQMLDVVYGLVNNMKVMMEGVHCLFIWCLHGMMHKSGRWEGINRQYERVPWCIELTFSIKAQGFLIL
jgi:hypothetical protein